MTMSTDRVQDQVQHSGKRAACSLVYFVDVTDLHFHSICQTAAVQGSGWVRIALSHASSKLTAHFSYFVYSLRDGLFVLYILLSARSGVELTSRLVHFAHKGFQQDLRRPRDHHHRQPRPSPYPRSNFGH